jgi:hypothetical protein
MALESFIIGTETTDLCAICLEEEDLPCSPCVAPWTCSHKFHASCVTKVHICPLCRSGERATADIRKCCMQCSRISTDCTKGKGEFANYFYCRACWDVWTSTRPSRITQEDFDLFYSFTGILLSTEELAGPPPRFSVRSLPHIAHPSDLFLGGGC